MAQLKWCQNSISTKTYYHLNQTNYYSYDVNNASFNTIYSLVYIVFKRIWILAFLQRGHCVGQTSRSQDEQELSSSWDGQPLATIHMGRKLGTCPFWGRELGPHLIQCRMGRGLPPYQVALWSIQPFDHNRHGPKIGGCVPCRGELGLHLTQSCLGRGLPPYQVAS